MSPDRFGAAGRGIGMQLTVPSIFAQHPSLPAVSQANVQNLPQLLFGAAIENRGDDLHALGEVAVHPVGRADEKIARSRVVLRRREVKDTGMLQVASDNRPDPDPVAEAGNSRPEATKPAHDQIHRYTGGRGFT